MKRRNNIFLIGMPGVGKSTLGKRWSDQLYISFLDLDRFIENSENNTVDWIIQNKGVDNFRLLESKVLREISMLHKTQIIACGGGTPCFYDNLKFMLENGTVILLSSDWDWMLDNIMEDGNKRPLLAEVVHDKKLLQNKLTELWKERRPYFAQAHYVLRVDEEIDSNFAILYNEIKSTLHEE